MSAETINQQLQAIYKSYVGNLYEKDWDENVSAHLLMHVFDDYIEKDKKIMFVGQETHGWGNMNKKESVEILQKKYESFDLGKHADYGDGKNTRYLRSPFWNFNRSLFCNINPCSRMPFGRRTNGFLWTNISKFDYKLTTPSQELQNLNTEGFTLLREEIRICRPDVVVFLTGEKYDERIKAMFHVADDKIEEGVPVWRVTATDWDLSSLMFKTEHPRTLCQSKNYRSRRMYHKVIEVITRGCNSIKPSL